MNYTIRARGVFLILKRSYRRELENHLCREDARRVTVAAKGLYRGMIVRSPSIAERKNPFVMSTLIAALTASVYKAAGGALSPEEMGGVFSRAVENTRVFRLVMKRRSKRMFTHHELERWRNLAIESGESGGFAGFVFDFVPGNTVNEYGLTFRECGICKLFAQEGCMELTPYMCGFDFVMAGYLGCRLTREHTIAAGDGFCDFHYSR
jgi:hypothetical protein